MRISRFNTLACRSRSYQRSTSLSHRPTGARCCLDYSAAQNIPGGVLIAAQHEAAIGTFMDSFGQIFRHSLTALGTFLARAFRVHCNNRTSGSFSLVCQLPAQSPPSSIHNMFCQAALHYFRNIQIFDGNKIVFTYQLFAQVVCKVHSMIQQFFVRFLEAKNRLESTFTSLFSTDHSPVLSAKLFTYLLKKSRILNRGAVAECCEMRQTHINANSFFDRSLLWFLYPILNDEVAVPLTCFEYDSLDLDCSLHRSEISAANKAVNSEDANPAILNTFIRLTNREAMPSPCRLESWKSRFGFLVLQITKESLKSIIQAIDSVTFYFCRNVSNIIFLLAPLSQVGSLVEPRNGLFRFFVGVNFLFKIMIIDKTSDAQIGFHAAALPLVRVYPYVHRSQHKNKIIMLVN